MSNLTGEEYTRLANNFYNSKGLESKYERIVTDSQLAQYVNDHLPDLQKKYKVGFLCICLNQPYWEFAKNMIDGAKRAFLPGHDVEYMLWSDMPETVNNATLFPTEAVEWPFPTLMRYNLFLQQEEYLKKFDYLFYCDIDMRFADVVGDEILGEGLTGALHPMYAVRREYMFPLEPNPQSSAYVKVPSYYYAGGFQGGKTADFITAMKTMKKNIDSDMFKNYVARWNDESHWNRYLLDNPPVITLSPSYIYPDSLIEEYYVKLWGKKYQPKLITLTKKFSTSKEGGDAVRKMLEGM